MDDLCVELVPMENLLIITSRYPHLKDEISGVYVYSQVEELKKYFEKVVVISTTPYIPSGLATILSSQRKLDSLGENYSYDNVDVYFTKNIVLPINILKKFRGWQGYMSLKKIFKKINFKPDIIHAHHTWPSGDIALRFREDVGSPVVITIHENRNWFLKELRDKKMNSIWRNADALIRVNKLDIPSLKKFNKKSFSIPNGYLHNKFRPMDRIACKKKLKIPRNKRVAFSLGHLTKRKGFQDLVEAARIIHEKRNDFLIVIGGNGPLMKNLKEKIISYDLIENVKLIGYVPDKDVPLWMNASDFFILPSYSEGNPTVMFETMGCGRPFVGTNVGGVPEIITDEKLGILVEPKDIGGLAKAILKTLDTKWDKDYILNYAKQFTWDKIAEKIMEVYDEVLKEV